MIWYVNELFKKNHIKTNDLYVRSHVWKKDASRAKNNMWIQINRA